MFERYTEKARRTIFFARYEASQFGSLEIESEHLLLGLLREGKSAMNFVIGVQGQEEPIRQEIEARSTRKEKRATSVDLPLTNECKRILAYGAEEAMRLESKHIGIEHLLLGILREEECFAAQILHARGVDLKTARKQIAAAKDQLAASAMVPRVEGMGHGSAGPSRSSVQIVNESGDVLLTLPGLVNIPRTGEAILIRTDESTTRSYRVRDVQWGMEDITGMQFLKEVKILVKEEIA